MGIALAEAMALTQSPVLRDPLEKVVDVMLRAQQAPKTDPLHQGGWRYKINDDTADLSVSGWVIMALKSARNAGVEIPQEVFDDAAEYVWNMFSGQVFAITNPAQALA